MSSRSMTKVLRFAVVAVAAGLFAACGGRGTLWAPPSPQDVLSKPVHASSLKDAHFLVSGKFATNGATVGVTGDGALLYKSPGAGRFKFQTTVAGQLVSF